MTTFQSIATIFAVVLGTLLTRFLPFFIFPEGKTPPDYILYLGTVLPCAVIGFLVVYSLKDAVFSSFHGLIELLSLLVVAGLQKKKKNTLLSISAGTALYMFLVQTWFH